MLLGEWATRHGDVPSKAEKQSKEASHKGGFFVYEPTTFGGKIRALSELPKAR